MLKNMKQNTKHQQEIRSLKDKLFDAEELACFKQKKCDQLQGFITSELDKYKDTLNKSIRSRNSSPSRSPTRSPTRGVPNGRMFPFGIEMGVQTDQRHHMVSQGVQYEKTVANMDSSLSI